uniref:Signal peptide protein n=1 Tax=Panagrellus redivivus TaxID=6233 RepID=A0A7E4VC62_PANRE
MKIPTTEDSIKRFITSIISATTFLTTWTTSVAQSQPPDIDSHCTITRGVVDVASSSNPNAVMRKASIAAPMKDSLNVVLRNKLRHIIDAEKSAFATQLIGLVYSKLINK